MSNTPSYAQAAANFALDVLDFSPDYEDDAGTFDLDGGRVYWERKRNHFTLHVGDEVFKLPR